MSDFIPRAYEGTGRRHAELRERYEAFAEACHEAEPLDRKARHLVKLGVAIGAAELAFHAQRWVPGFDRGAD